MEEDDPLWKRILYNEFLWVMVAALLVLGLAFHLATSKSKGPESADEQQR